MKLRTVIVLVLVLGFVSLQSYAKDPNPQPKRSMDKKGWLGVSIQDVTPRFARDHNLTVNEGAYVSDVVDESPAESAGIKEGDVITEFDGKKIEIADDLSDAVQKLKPGTKADLVAMRNDEKKTLSVTVGKMKPYRPMAWMPRGGHMMIDRFENLEGMDLMELNPQLGEYFNAPDNKGVLVKKVEQNSSAGKAGLKAGDVITKIGDRTVDDLEDLHESIANADEGDKLNVQVIRKGKPASMSLEITEVPDDPMMFQWGDGGSPDFHFRMPEIDHDIQRRLRMQIENMPGIQRDVQRIEQKISEIKI